MWGIVPAAGRGSRIQPLAFSKELLPVGSRLDKGLERPCAVSEYLVERMIRGGAGKICFVISPGKSDIMEYYGAGYGEASIAYVVQPQASGLCDAIFRATPLIAADEPVIVGLPDTVWFPESALCELPDDALSFLLFPVERPEFFDAVVLDGEDRVLEIQVKQQDAASHWIWGAFKMPGRRLHELERAVARASVPGRVYRHPRQRLPRRRRRGLGRQGRRRLCRCRHAAWLPRRDLASVRRGAGRGRLGGARRARLAGGPRARRIARRKQGVTRWMRSRR